ncbi:hypothetical protein G9A89_007281 [Geosiphon pyriformis]|nr:hypothetical protein G9A89_007281 [Geosiphon pyriformis]
MSLSKSESNEEILNIYQDELSVAEYVYSFDWSATQLGGIDNWPKSLISIVKLCLDSMIPIVLYIGPQKLTIYNQEAGSCLGDKHPRAMGRPAQEVWQDEWQQFGPMFEGVSLTGKGIFWNDMIIYLPRAGYNEECHFSFTYSPVFPDDKELAGFISVGYETTQKVLSVRRLKTLGELGNRTPVAKSVEGSCHLVTNVLRAHTADIPYALIYLIEKNQTDEKNQGYKVRLTATTFDENLLAQSNEDGVEDIKFVLGDSKRTLPDYLLNTPDILDVTDAMEDSLKVNSESKTSHTAQKLSRPESSTVKDNILSPNLDNFPFSSNLTTWPIEKVIRTNHHVGITFADEFQAVLFPVSISFAGKNIMTAVLICGLNRHRMFDQDYLRFCQLVVRHMSLSLTNGKSREEERNQAKILADLNRQKIMFFQNISHELKTPLTLILAPLEDTITACKPASPIIYNLQMIQRNARRLLKLVNNLLQLSKMEAGHGAVRYRETNIAKLTRELAYNFESMAESFGLKFKIDIPLDEVLEIQLKRKVYLDLDLYEKIILNLCKILFLALNLCSNAFKYTWKGGVTIRLYPGKNESGEVIFVEFTDTGVGIAKSQLKNLFRNFYQIESQSSRSYEGGGIGLAFVKESIKKHGGDIKVTSQVGVGTTFQIWIPTGSDHLPENYVINKNELSSNDKLQITSSWDNQLPKNIDLYLEETQQWNVRKHEFHDLHSRLEDDDDPKKAMEYLKTLSIASPKELYRVLIVGDNNDMRNYLANILKTEFEVCCACDGLHALTIINEGEFKPNLVLTDIMMPHMNAFELLKILRSDPTTRTILVIFLSARAGEEASVEGLNEGADDYLIKPFNKRELIARVRANIKLFNLRHALITQNLHQNQTQQLLFSISNKIRSGLNIQEILSMAVKEINQILNCHSVLIIVSDPINKGLAKILAVSAYYPEMQALVGTKVPCEAVGDDQEISADQLTGSPEIDSSTRPFSSFLPSFTQLVPDPLAPVKGISVPLVNRGDIKSDFLDLEIKSHINHFSQILHQSVSSVSVAIRLNSSFWGWIFAHRKPDETWSDSEKMFLQQVSNQISLAITHSKLSEEKLKREIQMEAATAINKAKSQILANISHELRTPLGAIIGVLSAFEDTRLTPDQKDMVQIMTHASDVVLSIINDILDAAKLEAHKVTLKNRTFDLFDLVEKTVEIFGERAGSKKIELVLLCEQPNELPKYVKSDPERVKFTETGEISLKISLMPSGNAQVKAAEPNIFQKQTLMFELTDTGIGIHPNFIKDIWESFAQGDPSIHRCQEGTGLGLSICKYLVTINGGDVGVESNLVKGSRFWFTWNLEFLAFDGTSPTSSTQMASIERLLVIPPTVKSKKIVVIDPIETSRSALVAMLSSGVQKVEAFEDGSKAVIATKAWHERYRCSPCDVVFFNVGERNADQVLTTAKEFQSICGKDSLAIGLFVFWSVEGRALGNELIKKIGGHTAALCKPIMQRRLLNCLENMEIFYSAKMDEPQPLGFSFSRFRMKDSDHYDRPKFYSSSESPIIRNVHAELEEIDKTEISTVQEDSTILSTHFSFEELPTILTRSISPNPSSKRPAPSEISESTRSELSFKSRTRNVSQSKCILCVQYNNINLKITQRDLSKLGYQTLCATNGQEAVNIMQGELGTSFNSADILKKQSRVALILMDVNMPIMSGFDTTKAIRAMGSEIPIIGLTPSASVYTRNKCFESGMNDILSQPLKISLLKEKLMEWLGDN